MPILLCDYFVANIGRGIISFINFKKIYKARLVWMYVHVWINFACIGYSCHLLYAIGAHFSNFIAAMIVSHFVHS